MCNLRRHKSESLSFEIIKMVIGFEIQLQWIAPLCSGFGHYYTHTLTNTIPT